MIVKMTILRLLGSSDDKERIGVTMPEGPPQLGFCCPRDKNWRDREEIQVEKIKTKQICYHRLNRWWANLYSSVQWTWHRINRRWVFYTHRLIDLEYTRLGFYTGWTDAKEIAYVGALTNEDRRNSIHRLNRRLGLCERRCSCPES